MTPELRKELVADFLAKAQQAYNDSTRILHQDTPDAEESPTWDELLEEERGFWIASAIQDELFPPKVSP